MLIRLLLFFPFLAAAATDTEVVNFDRSVQIPEAVLQPGSYKIHLEDQLPDRAIVRITEPSGVDHYLLTVPSRKVDPGLTFFKTSKSAAIQSWECKTCAKSLEFVYPKDEAIKLTAATGQSVMAYDAAYDKLPAGLSPADRKVVTLWLLHPNRTSPAGLTAVKYSAPHGIASSAIRMPKTASNAFSEIMLGTAMISLAALLMLLRRLAALRNYWAAVGTMIVLGMIAGFTVPLVASYQHTAAPVMDRDSELARIKARNRRLEVLVNTLRQQTAQPR